MKSYISTIFIFLSIFFACYVYAEDEGFESFEVERRQEAEKEGYKLYKEASKSRDSQIEFFGAVKDQFGNPVLGARVDAHYQHFHLFSDYFTKSSDVSTSTDAEGLFDFKGLKGRLLSIDTIEKKGYTFDFRKNPNRYFSYEAGRYNTYVPDKQNPIILILYKKPEPAYVIEKSISYQGRPEGSKFQIDVYKGFTQSSQTITNAWGDMRVEVQPAANVGEHTIKITLNNQDDWVLVKSPSDDPVEDHAGPHDGYGKSVEFMIKQHDELRKDIYYKGQKETGMVYARLHLKLSAGSASVHVEGELYTNLDGGKNLNYDRKYTLNRKIQDVSARIDKEPGNAKLYKERAELKERLFLYDDAISDVSKAIKIEPESRGFKRFKEELQFGKERMAERKAKGHKFPD